MHILGGAAKTCHLYAASSALMREMLVPFINHKRILFPEIWDLGSWHLEWSILMVLICLFWQAGSDFGISTPQISMYSIERLEAIDWPLEAQIVWRTPP